MSKRRSLFLALLMVLVVGCAQPCPVCPPTPVPTTVPTPSPIMWDGRLTELGLSVLDMPGDWDLEAAWLTESGDWGTAPQWAKDRYPWENLGGDRNAYGLAYTNTGLVQTDKGFLLSWPDGAAKTTAQESSHPYWGNLPIGPSGFDWTQTSGPYSWETYGGDRIVGLGLPYPPLPWQETTALGGVHVSFFAVWRQK